MSHSREKMVGLTARLLNHHLKGTTDHAEDIMRISLDAYTNEKRLKLEINTIFHNYPLALALSLELPKENTYKALNVLETPILLTRDSQGRARAFINACQHRGSPICELGSGERSQFSCPYHTWTYNNEGNLINIFKADTFGDIDRSKIKLKELNCEERSGFIWVCINPESKMDLDSWLCDFDLELNDIGLDKWHLYKQRELPGPSWKICWDGYLDGYHHHVVHPETVGKNTIVNLIAHDSYGPHQRFAFGKKTLSQLKDLDEKEWEPEEHIRLIHSGFPNLSISVILNQYCLVSMVYPCEDLNKTVTIQNILCMNEPNSREEKIAAEEFDDLALSAVRDEDYKMNFSIQAGVKSKGNKEFLFGKNEPLQQHYHKWIEKLCNQEF